MTRLSGSALILLCTVVFANRDAAASGTCDEKGARDGYQGLFYPSGMPVRDNDFTGQKQTSVYTCYDATEARGSNTRFILYSESLPVERSDGEFFVRLGIVRAEGDKAATMKVQELTDYIGVFTEFPGNFQTMDGRLNVFPIAKGLLGLHVNLWAMLSGTGAIGSATDLVFQFKEGQENSVQLVLDLRATSASGRTGYDNQGRMDSTVSVADLDADGVTEIIVEGRSEGEDAGKRYLRVQEPRFYKYVEGRYTLAQGKVRDELVRSRAARSVLKRSPRRPLVDSDTRP